MKTKAKDENDEVRLRQQAFSEMSEKLQQLAKKIDEKVNRATKGNVLVAFGIGQTCDSQVKKRASSTPTRRS